MDSADKTSPERTCYFSQVGDAGGYYECTCYSCQVGDAAGYFRELYPAIREEHEHCKAMWQKRARPEQAIADAAAGAVAAAGQAHCDEQEQRQCPRQLQKPLALCCTGDLPAWVGTLRQPRHGPKPPAVPPTIEQRRNRKREQCESEAASSQAPAARSHVPTHQQETNRKSNGKGKCKGDGKSKHKQQHYQPKPGSTFSTKIGSRRQQRREQATGHPKATQHQARGTSVLASEPDRLSNPSNKQHQSNDPSRSRSRSLSSGYELEREAAKEAHEAMRNAANLLQRATEIREGRIAVASMRKCRWSDVDTGR